MLSPSMSGVHGPHDKVMILDGVIVVTGSYNWTLAAENKNGENLLVIRDPRLTAVYTENWRRHADHSIPYQGPVPWWAYIRGVWVSFIRRRRQRLSTEFGYHCSGARLEER